MSEDEKQGGRRAELEAIFKDWDDRKLDVPEELTSKGSFEPVDEFLAPDPTLWRGLFALAVIVSAVFIMSKTQNPFNFWFESRDGAVQLGDLREPWKAGKALKIPDNRFVEASGLFATYRMTGTTGGSSEGASCKRDSDCGSDGFCRVPQAKDSKTPWSQAGSEDGVCVSTDIVKKNYFLCPLYNIIVQTSQPFPGHGGHGLAGAIVDPAFARLIQERKAFPTDLARTLSVSGRLLSYGRAPQALKDIITQYSSRLKEDPDTFWILIDQDTPSEYTKYGLIWAGCCLAPIVPLFLFGRAFVRRRRRRLASR